MEPLTIALSHGPDPIQDASSRASYQFALPLVSGHAPWSPLEHTICSGDLPERPVVLMLICSHCPFVKHIEPEITRLEADFGTRATMLAISSNSLSTHPQDGPDGMRDQACQQGWTFPYLLDGQQTLAKDLWGACTPEFYLFSPNANGTQTLRYRGQLDGSRPGNDRPLDVRSQRSPEQCVGWHSCRHIPITLGGLQYQMGAWQEPPWFGQST